MKTKFRKEGAAIIVSMHGKIDVESSEPFRDEMESLLNHIKGKAHPSKTDASDTQVIFDMKELEFVGSSGISAFIHALRDFHRRLPAPPRYHNVRSEFQKFMRAFDDSALFEFFEDESATFGRRSRANH